MRPKDNVLFHVPSMPDYGKLSNRPLDEMIAGAASRSRPTKKTRRTSCCGSRRSRASRAGRRRPASRRRAGPGWHIECSAMAWKHSRRDLRHPRRRHRSRLSAPRERDRAIALRLPHAGDGELLDAQRLPAGRRREDVEEPRQLRDHPRIAEGLAGRGAPLHDAANALPAADQLDGASACAKRRKCSITGTR